jgi:hypothetical protein
VFEDLIQTKARRSQKEGMAGWTGGEAPVLLRRMWPGMAQIIPKKERQKYC